MGNSDLCLNVWFFHWIFNVHTLLLLYAQTGIHVGQNFDWVRYSKIAGLSTSLMWHGGLNLVRSYKIWCAVCTLPCSHKSEPHRPINFMLAANRYFIRYFLIFYWFFETCFMSSLVFTYFNCLYFLHSSMQDYGVVGGHTIKQFPQASPAPASSSNRGRKAI